MLLDIQEYPELVKVSGYSKSRYIPCNELNKPLVKWSEIRCTLDQANLWPGKKFLAENLKGTPFIVIDFDIDHNNEIDWRLREFAWDLLNDYPTHCIFKKGLMSMHLTYIIDREIPTQHFPEHKIDVCGNANNQLRYYKNKKWNKHKPIKLPQGAWTRLMEKVNQ